MLCHGISQDSKYKTFQPNSTMRGRFLPASITPLQLIVFAHLWIYLPSPLMIEPNRIKWHDIPPVCPQLTSLFSLKIMSVLLTLLIIQHNFFSYLVMILTLTMQYLKMILTVSGWEEVIAIGEKMKQYATKIQGCIALCALIKKINFIIVMFFQY